MRIGTSHFVTRLAAIRYYWAYHGDGAPAYVAEALENGSIHIGAPALKAGETLERIDGGLRYAIETN